MRFESLIINGTAPILQMSRFELIEQTLLGNIGDSVPIAIWKNHPERDRTPEGLAESEIALHRQFGHDLMRISLHDCYPVVDWGCVPLFSDAVSGSTKCGSCVVRSPADWEVLEPLDVNAGEFGRQIRAVQLIHRYAQVRVPTMVPVLDSSAVADRLCEEKFAEYIVESPDIMKSVLEMVTGVMIDFGRAVLDAGADGLFIVSERSTDSEITEDQYKEFVLPYNLKLIARLQRRAKFIIMHLHASAEAETVPLERVARIPGLDGLSWEDQRVGPTLREGKAMSRRAVLGGIDYDGPLKTGSRDEAKEQVLSAVHEAGLERLIVAPGCDIPMDTPEHNIHAVLDAIRSIVPWTKEWEE